MSESADGAKRCWVGRMRVEGRSRCVRMLGGERPPAASDFVDVIDDPFDDERVEEAGSVWHGALQAEARAQVRVGDHQLLPPVRALNVIGIGRNYRAHAAELGNEVPTEPLVFLKAASCLVAHGAEVELPRGYERIDLESELVLVIGRKAHRIAAQQAWDYVAGWTLGNDVSNRDLQKRDKQWTRAKGFDGAGPCGPWIRLNPPGFAPDMDAISIVGEHNGREVQRGRARDMIFSVPELLAYLSATLTLHPGDLIYTGTPEGVTPLVPGSRVTIRSEGLELGELSTTFI